MATYHHSGVDVSLLCYAEHLRHPHGLAPHEQLVLGGGLVVEVVLRLGGGGGTHCPEKPTRGDRAQGEGTWVEQRWGRRVRVRVRVRVRDKEG